MGSLFVLFFTHFFATAQTPFFDLALRKTTTFTNVAIGQEIKFTITIFNQGTITATNIGVIDYLGNQFQVGPSNPSAWVLGAANTTAARVITSLLLPGDSVKLDIYLIVKPGYTGTITNTAEITSTQDNNYVNTSLDDIDSTPDGFNYETNVKDNIINENGRLGGDEDDHDIANVFVVPDVKGYESVKLVGDVNANGLVNVGDTVLYTVTFTNTANPSPNFQITDLLPVGLVRCGTITGSVVNVTGFSLNPSYTGVGASTTLLNAGITMGYNGVIVINIPCRVLQSANGLSVSSQPYASGNFISSNVLTDAIDNTFCSPPAMSSVSVPAGSILQSCTNGLDPTIFFVQNNPLPVELVGFDLKKSDENVKIHWETKSELQTKLYQVERSLDGNNFIAIENVTAVGLKNFTANYEIIDKFPYPNNYYRLKIIDKDGLFEYSEVKNISFDDSREPTEIKIFPNPIANRNFSISLKNIKNEEYFIEIIDTYGKIILNKSVEVSDDRIIEKFENLNLKTSQLYFLVIYSKKSAQVFSSKFMSATEE